MSTVLDRARAFFDYAVQPLIQRMACPACGAALGTEAQKVDRCGWPIVVVTCPCTLRYLRDIMTPAGYQALYAGNPSPYRLMCWALNSPQPYNQAKYDRMHRMANDVYVPVLKQFLWDYLGNPEMRLLDVGGSAGMIAEALDLPVTILDPSSEAGPGQFRTTAEDWDPEGIYDGILVCRTLEHLQDPYVVFQKLRTVIDPTGWLFVDWVASPFKIDHTTYWTRTALTHLLERTGWRVEGNEFRVNQRRGVVCRPS